LYLRALSSGVVSPLHYQGIFVPHSSAASTARPSATIHELWFSNSNQKSNHSIDLTNYNNMQQNNHQAAGPPPKPTKLTPLYSRKRSEITNVDESVFANNNTKSKTDLLLRNPTGIIRKETFREKLRRELSNPDVHINDPFQFNEPNTTKNKKKKIKKKDLNSSNESGAGAGVGVVAAANENETEQKMNESIDNAESQIVNAGNILEPEKVTRLNSFVKNSIDDIWNSSALQPSIDDSVDLGKIDEEFITNNSSEYNRTKILGARKVKTPVPSLSANFDDTNKSNNNNNNNEVNSSISIRFGSAVRATSATRSRVGDFFNKDDDNVKLVDEFNRENQTSSSSSSVN